MTDLPSSCLAMDIYHVSMLCVTQKSHKKNMDFLRSESALKEEEALDSRKRDGIKQEWRGEWERPPPYCSREPAVFWGLQLSLH